MEDSRSGEPTGLTKVAIQDLRRRGLRLTPQRLMILELLEKSKDEHIAPEDIYQQVHRHYPMINRSTIYRTLEVLEQVGLVRHGHVEDGAARYHLTRDCHHLHLICHKCGQSVDVTDLSIAEALAEALRQRFSFEADLTHFPISGLCAACARMEAAGPGEQCRQAEALE